MPTALPANHITDSLSLKADARINLFELYPLPGGTIYFKSDNTVTWLGNVYEGLPCALSGEEWDTEKTVTPRLQIGQENLDLLPFKGLVHDGYLDGASITRRVLLLDDLVNNRNIKQTIQYRVKRVESYSRSSITLQLTSLSSAVKQTVPFRQYLPPEFPWVDL